MASRELQLAIELSRFSRRKRRPTIVDLGHLAELQAQYDDIADSHLIRGKVTETPADAGGVDARWIQTPAARGDRVILYLHGGCYGTGSVQTHRDLIARLSIETSARVLGINYRLAPTNPFPAAVDDAAAAYRWLIQSGISPARIAIAGDSAGAGLALALTLKDRDEDVPLPSAVACFSPWVDLALTGDSMDSKAAEDPIVSREMLTVWAKLYLGEHDPRTPFASPLYGDLRGLPPLLIQVGSAEVLIDDSLRLAERARQAGVETTVEVWPEMIHVWHSFAAILPEARQAIEQAARFIRSHIDA